MKTYSIEFRDALGQTGYSTLLAESFVDVTTKFITIHPNYRIIAIAERI